MRLDYHSTREQLRRDADRQAALVATGFRVIRHSGSDIFRNPERVVSRTLTEFAGQGWKPPSASLWVNNATLLRALAGLRQQSEGM